MWKQMSGRLFVRDVWAVTRVDYVWRIEVPGPTDVLWPYREILLIDFATAQEAMAYVDAKLAVALAPSADAGDGASRGLRSQPASRRHYRAHRAAPHPESPKT
jgi:hypothetical protein